MVGLGLALARLEPDIFVVVAFGQILPQALLDPQPPRVVSRAHAAQFGRFFHEHRFEALLGKVQGRVHAEQVRLPRRGGR